MIEEKNSTAEKSWRSYQDDIQAWLQLSNYERWKRERKLKKEAKKRQKLLDFANERR